MLTIVGLTLASSGALAEELEDPAGTACLGAGDEAECGTIALSPEEDASCQEERCVAVSGDGNATGFAAASGTGDSDGSYAASLTGNATASFAVSGTGDSQGFFLAASGLGDSEAPGLALSVTGDSEAGLVAISGTGETDALVVEINGMQDADGFVAVSGTGHAEGSTRSVSGCDTGREAGTDEACRDPDERHHVAETVVCDTDLASSDGDAHAWCGLLVTGCAEVVWGVGAGPVFVGGHDGCQAGAFYDEDGHDHAVIG